MDVGGGRGGRGGHGVVVVDAEVLEDVEEELVEHVGFGSISFSSIDFWVYQVIGENDKAYQPACPPRRFSSHGVRLGRESPNHIFARLHAEN